MSADLRAPDPTLSKMPPMRVMLIRQSANSAALTAHGLKRLRPPTCTAPYGALRYPTLWASDAAYIAVPCRDCFPDAPPPGQRTHGGDRPPADLAWQVPDREHADG